MPRVNPKPLNIGVIDIPLDAPALVAFAQKGHHVYELGSPSERLLGAGDVIIGPKCWRIDPRLKLGDDKTEEESLERQLEMVERGIRAIKYPKETKDAK